MLGGEVCSFMSIFVIDFNLNQVLADKSLWGEDLSALPGFEAAVQKYI